MPTITIRLSEDEKADLEAHARAVGASQQVAAVMVVGGQAHVIGARRKPDPARPAHDDRTGGAHPAESQHGHRTPGG